MFPLRGPADDDLGPIDSAPIDVPMADASIDGAMTTACPASYTTLAPLPHKYRVVLTAAMWQAAEADCESDQGHLAVPRDATDMMNYTVLVGARAWAGVARDSAAPNDGFRSITGKAFPPNGLWQTDEPNGTGPVAEIANANGFLMNDATLFFSNRYICECDGSGITPFNF